MDSTLPALGKTRSVLNNSIRQPRSVSKTKVHDANADWDAQRSPQMSDNSEDMGTTRRIFVDLFGLSMKETKQAATELQQQHDQQ